MATRLLVLPRLSYKSVSLLLLMAALLGLAIADLRVTALDPWLAESTVHLYEAVARGALADVTDTLERVLGRSARRAFEPR